MLQSSDQQTTTHNLLRHLGFLAWLFAICVALWHYALIWLYAVDVPHWDEWEAFHGREQLPNQISWSWLIAQHNEHRILLTRLQTWLLMKLDHWDLATQIRLNFLIFLSLVGLLIWIIRRTVPKAPGWFLALCFLSQLSGLPIENHTWGFQSQFHFTLLALFCAVILMISPRPSWLRIFFGLFAMVLAMFSFSAGLSGSVMVIGTFVIHRWFMIQGRAGFDVRREIGLIIFVIATWAAAVAYYLTDYLPTTHAPPVFPYQFRFWEHFSNLLALGFGYTWVDSRVAILCATLVLAPVILCTVTICRRSTRQAFAPESYRLLSVYLVVLTALAAISIGRGGFDLINSKASRYAEFASLLIPCALTLWLVNNSSSSPAPVQVKRWFLILTILTTGMGLCRHWDLAAKYQKIADQRKVGRDCALATLAGQANGFCPSIYPDIISDRLKIAKDLGVSFTRPK